MRRPTQRLIDVHSWILGIENHIYILDYLSNKLTIIVHLSQGTFDIRPESFNNVGPVASRAHVLVDNRLFAMLDVLGQYGIICTLNKKHGLEVRHSDDITTELLTHLLERGT